MTINTPYVLAGQGPSKPYFFNIQEDMTPREAVDLVVFLMALSIGAKQVSLEEVELSLTADMVNNLPSNVARHLKEMRDE